MGATRTDNDTFIHFGVISAIRRNTFTVALDENIHCESCRAKGSCGIAESNSREVVVSDAKGTFEIDEPVAVVLKKALGLKAVFWAYLFPFVLMVGTLLLASIFMTEWMAGVFSLLILIPYYFALYVFRGAFKKSFKISLLKV